ncbi:ABC transporter ATP-binding protein [Parageobacillus thermoglucosidasius]|uniref:ABC transporter ATP-binding protein n=1 Tax=Parageobacillus thermoglucosidasius TaxID=1426 RepID=A0A1B7KUA9_PARTM|nr:ABC transporter ATP-binding protein [Parageobacillus thermoglucosidasius]OAT73613.1 ABC transporter ATP-binding protein [Parageobacillus thermoglucosidasius]
MEHVLEVQSVTKKIDNKTIVDSLSFHIKRGEILGLLGPNGAGKTTTMRMIVGLASITEGDIFIEGHSIKTNFKQAISKVGVVVEAPSFYPFLSGYDNLKYYARMAKGVTVERIKEIVELLGLEHAIHKKTKTYSLGMRQRLGIAQALLHRPSLLILDEPTNGLDPAGIREMRDYLKKVARHEGTAILVSSHLLAEIELMCDRVVIIQNGKHIKTYDITEKSAQEEITFIVGDAEKAAQVLGKEFEGAPIRVKDHALFIQMKEEDIPSVVKALVSYNIDLYYIYRSKQSLEDIFLEATGGNIIE